MRNLESLMMTLRSLVIFRKPLVMTLLPLMMILQLPLMALKAVFDGSSSSQGMPACSCGMSWICARWNSVSATAVSSGVFLLSCGMFNTNISSNVCPSCLDTLCSWSDTVRATAGVVDALTASASWILIYSLRAQTLVPRLQLRLHDDVAFPQLGFPATRVVVMPRSTAVVGGKMCRPRPDTNMLGKCVRGALPLWSVMVP